MTKHWWVTEYHKGLYVTEEWSEKFLVPADNKEAAIAAAHIEEDCEVTAYEADLSKLWHVGSSDEKGPYPPDEVEGETDATEN